MIHENRNKRKQDAIAKIKNRMSAYTSMSTRGLWSNFSVQGNLNKFLYDTSWTAKRLSKLDISPIIISSSYANAHVSQLGNDSMSVSMRSTGFNCSYKQLTKYVDGMNLLFPDVSISLRIVYGTGSKPNNWEIIFTGKNQHYVTTPTKSNPLDGINDRVDAKCLEVSASIDARIEELVNNRVELDAQIERLKKKRETVRDDLIEKILELL